MARAGVIGASKFSAQAANIPRGQIDQPLRSRSLID